MGKKILGFVFAAGLLVAVAVPLFGGAGTAQAGHAHWLDTPGTCVVDIGSGQTSISDSTHGGYHQFHENVHLGEPGVHAFANPNNPVSVGKDAPCP